MKYATFMLVFCWSFSFAQDELYPEHLSNVNGVKQCLVYNQVLIHRQDKTPQLWAQHYLDENGNDTLIIYYFMGKVREKKTFSYDKDVMISCKEYGGEIYDDTTSHWSGEVLTSERTFTYQDKKLIRISVTSYSGGEVGHSFVDTFLYQPDGNLSCHVLIYMPMPGITIELPDDTVRSEYFYNDTIVIVKHFQHNIFNSTETRTMSKTGLLLSKVFRNNKGVVTQTLKYHYNSNGLLQEGNYSVLEGTPAGYFPCTREVISYDNAGRIAKKMEYTNKVLMGILSYQYLQ